MTFQRPPNVPAFNIPSLQARVIVRVLQRAIAAASEGLSGFGIDW